MLTSTRQLHLWTMLEANPGVTRYCERPTWPDLAGIADHTRGLETAALAAGYASWHELQQANQRHNADAQPPDAQPESAPPPAPATGLIVDPVLPDSFDNTPNERRSRKELD